MSDDEPKRPGIDTRPPPPGEEDLYSASTVVGQASAELLAIVAAAETVEPKLVVKPRPSERPIPKPEELTDEQKLDAMKAEASRSAKQAAANEVAREAKAEAIRQASSAPPAEPATATATTTTEAKADAAAAAAPVPVPVPVKEAPKKAPPREATAAPREPAARPSAVRGDADETAKRPAVRTAADDIRPAAGLPPIVPILALFAAAALVLAALVR